MNWIVIKEENIDGTNFTLQAEGEVSASEDWWGIQFLADSASPDTSGYLFRLTGEGYSELILLSENAEAHILQRRKTGSIIPNHPYRIIIEKKDNIFTGFLEDALRASSASLWPLFELPLPAVTGNFAALVISPEHTEVLGKGKKPLYHNFRIRSLPCSEPALPSIPQYQNPILNGYADPDVLFYQGTYYLYATSSTMPVGFEAYQSKDLVNWEYSGRIMEEAWGQKRWYWAPGIIEKGGKFYLLASVNEHLGIAVSTSPVGPFIPEPDYLFDKTIDGHFFLDEDGSLYIYYVSWREGKTYAVYAMKMEDDCVTPILMSETLVIKADDEWELQQAPVAEAPYVIKHKDKYYLTYSGSHFESKGYAVGYAISDSPLGPFVKYEGNPILSHHYLAHGPGHHCLVKAPHSEDIFIIYHTHHNTEAVQPRNICIDRIRFVPEEGKEDRLEVYGPTVTPQPYPFPIN